jgi:uncharacterized protein YecT (DUF1311 family)
MKLILLLVFISIINIISAQQYPWTSKCEQAQSQAEIGTCLSSSCKEANTYVDKVYDSLYRKVQLEYKKYDKGSVQFEIFIQVHYLFAKIKKESC